MDAIAAKIMVEQIETKVFIKIETISNSSLGVEKKSVIYQQLDIENRINRQNKRLKQIIDKAIIELFGEEYLELDNKLLKEHFNKFSTSKSYSNCHNLLSSENETLENDSKIYYVKDLHHAVKISSQPKKPSKSFMSHDVQENRFSRVISYNCVSDSININNPKGESSILMDLLKQVKTSDVDERLNYKNIKNVESFKTNELKSSNIVKIENHQLYNDLNLTEDTANSVKTPSETIDIVEMENHHLDNDLNLTQDTINSVQTTSETSSNMVEMENHQLHKNLNLTQNATSFENTTLKTSDVIKQMTKLDTCNSYDGMINNKAGKREVVIFKIESEICKIINTNDDIFKNPIINNLTVFFLDNDILSKSDLFWETIETKHIKELISKLFGLFNKDDTKNNVAYLTGCFIFVFREILEKSSISQHEIKPKFIVFINIIRKCIKKFNAELWRAWFLTNTFLDWCFVVFCVFIKKENGIRKDVNENKSLRKNAEIYLKKVTRCQNLFINNLKTTKPVKSGIFEFSDISDIKNLLSSDTKNTLKNVTEPLIANSPELTVPALFPRISVRAEFKECNSFKKYTFSDNYGHQPDLSKPQSVLINNSDVVGVQNDKLITGALVTTVENSITNILPAITSSIDKLQQSVNNVNNRSISLTLKQKSPDAQVPLLPNAINTNRNKSKIKSNVEHHSVVKKLSRRHNNISANSNSFNPQPPAVGVETPISIAVNTSNSLGINTSNSLNMNASNSWNTNASNSWNMNASNSLNMNTGNSPGMYTNSSWNMDASNSLNMNTSNSWNMNASNSLNMNTSNSSNMNTSNSLNMNTSNSSNMNTSNSLNMNTSNSLNMNTSNSSSMNTSNSSSMNTSNSSSMNTSNSWNTNASNSWNMNASNSLNINTGNLPCINTNNSWNMNASNSLSMNTGNSPGMNTSNSWNMNFNNSLNMITTSSLNTQYSTQSQSITNKSLNNDYYCNNANVDYNVANPPSIPHQFVSRANTLQYANNYTTNMLPLPSSQEQLPSSCYGYSTVVTSRKEFSGSYFSYPVQPTDALASAHSSSDQYYPNQMYNVNCLPHTAIKIPAKTWEPPVHNPQVSPDLPDVRLPNMPNQPNYYNANYVTSKCMAFNCTNLQHFVCCQNARYCSVQCQQTDWHYHKNECSRQSNK